MGFNRSKKKMKNLREENEKLTMQGKVESEKLRDLIYSFNCAYSKLKGESNE